MMTDREIVDKLIERDNYVTDEFFSPVAVRCLSALSALCFLILWTMTSSSMSSISI